MRKRAELLWKLLCSFALVVVALPVRAGMVCVSHGRIVCECTPLAALPKGGVCCQCVPIAPSRTTPAACCEHCRPIEPAVQQTQTSVTDRDDLHCETTYRFAYLPQATASAFAHDQTDSAFIAPPRFTLQVSRAELNPVVPLVDRDNGPPPKCPYVPDRGRAPPVQA